MQKNNCTLLKEQFGNFKKAVVVGNGPSTNNVDWDKINNSKKRSDVVFLSTNRISLLFEKTKWRPDIYSCFTSVSLTDSVWRDSVDKCLENDKIFSFVFEAYRKFSSLEKFHDNVCFTKKVAEHYRHSEVPKNFISVSPQDAFLKSYSATTTLFQICDFLGFEKIGVIGQDGYIFDRGKNHFDDSYKYETASFEKANTRILKVHKELKRYFYDKGVSIYNLSSKSILGDLYPCMTLENFIKE